MTQTYNITGMTCSGCVASVSNDLISIKGVLKVDVSLEKGEVEIESDKHVLLGVLQSAISDSYKISLKKDNVDQQVLASIDSKTKWKQLRPLFLIFFYLFAASFLLNYKDWDTKDAMMDFMGLSFRMYDPLAKVFPAYGWVYPFIELALGLMFLMRFQITIALILTLLILGLTTIGVSRTLLDKKNIQCACLGTALKLPMTEATFIENAIMLLMALVMLLS